MISTLNQLTQMTQNQAENQIIKEAKLTLAGLH